MLVFVLHQSIGDEHWPQVQKYIKPAFFGTNDGLVLMIALNLFAGGVRQRRDVTENGYWHTRLPEFTGSTIAKTLEWLRCRATPCSSSSGRCPC